MKTKHLLLLLLLAAIMAPRTALAQKTHIASTSSSTAMTWAEFADIVNNGTTYEGMTVYLDEDITATKMVGTDQNNCFKGTFDGQGHSITFNYSNTSEDWCAPFHYLNGTTICNLIINGTITANYDRCGGLAGNCYGTNAIINCLNNITINSTVNGDGTHGGFISRIYRGSTTFEGCTFAGSLIGENTTANGGFVGWSEGNNNYASVSFSNCIYAPVANTTDPSAGATFARGRNNSTTGITISNCFYTSSEFQYTQGKQLYTVTAQSPATVAMNGTATNHNVSHITAYEGNQGLLYNGTIVAGAGDNVSLNLGGAFSYNADHGTITGSANPYTLSMEAYNTTISAIIHPASFPYSTGFEDACDWMLVNGNCANQWCWGTAASHDGTHGLFISNNGGTTNAYTNNSTSLVYAYKGFHFEAGMYHFQYDWKAYGETDYDFMRVALVPATLSLQATTGTPSDFTYYSLPSGWIALDGGSQLNQATDWQTMSIEMEITSAGDYNMVFAWRNDYADGTNPPAAIDNVIVESTSCPLPDNLTVGTVRVTTAELSWTAYPEVETYVVQYKKTSENQWQTVSVAGGSDQGNVTLTGLTPETEYQAQVYAECNPNALTPPVYFTTTESCPPPTSLINTNTTATTATLQWTENGEATAWQICLNDDETNLITADSNPFTLTGLTAYTTYTAKVRSNCGTEQSAWSNTVSFVAADKVVIGSGSDTHQYLPLANYWNYSLSEQIYTPDELGELGKIVSIDFYKTGSVSSNRNLDLYMVHTDANEFETSASLIPVTASDRVFSGTVSFADDAWTTIMLDTPFIYDGIHNVVVIVHDLTGNHVADAHFLSFTTSDNQAVYKYEDFYFGTPTGTTYSAYPPVNVKNQIRVTKTPVLPWPTDLQCTAFDANSATLEWTENGTATAWQICLNDDETNLITADSNPFTLTGLTADTYYTAKVRATAGTEQSEWSNSVSFLATDKTIVGSGSGQDDALPCDNYVNFSLSQQIYTPAELDGAGKILGISFFKADAVNCTRNLTIYMVHTNKNAFENNTDWIGVTVADRVFYGTVHFADNAWTTITLDAPFYYNGIDNLALVVDDNTGNAVDLTHFKSYVASSSLNQSIYKFSDDSDIDPTGTIGACFGRFPAPDKSQMLVDKTYAKPTAMSSSVVRYTTAHLTWTEYGTATAWQICLDDDETNLVEATSNPFVIKNLSPGTTYTAKVRATYGDEHSEWSDSMSFTTIAAIEVPYSFGFENTYFSNQNSDPDKWRCVSGQYPGQGYTNGCFRKNASDWTYNSGRVSHTGSCYLYLPYRGEIGNEPPIIAMPYFPDNISRYTLEFWVKHTYRYFGTLEVGYLTDLYDASTFVPVRSIDITYYNEHAISTENGYAKVSVNFNDVPDGVYIAFRGNETQGYWLVDDVSLTEVSQLSDLTVHNITATSAEIQWNGPMNVSEYSIRLQEIQKNLFEEHFDGGMFHYDWTLVNCHQYTGPYSDEFGFYQSSTAQYLISPELTGLQDDMHLLFFGWRHGSGYGCQVGFSSTDTDTTSFNFGQEITSRVFNFDELVPPGTKYFCIKVLPTDATFDFDDIVVGYPEVFMRYYVEDSHTEQYYEVNNGNLYHNFFTFTGLKPDYEYDIRVGLYVNGNYSGWQETSFRTPLDFYSADFDSICDWTLVNGNCANAWTWGTAGGNGGLYISNDGGASNAYTNTNSAMVYATKTLDFEAGVYHFAFDWKANGQTDCDYLRVALAPASANLQAGTAKPAGFGASTLPTGWIALDGGSQLNSATEWQTVGNNIIIPTDGAYQMVLAWWNDDTGGDNPPAAIDNVSICSVACPSPLNLTLGDVSPTTAALHWDGPATMDSYTMRYRTVGTHLWQTKNVEGGSTHVIGALTGLTPETQYEVQVQSDCDNALWSETISFTTEAYDYFYTFDFESLSDWTLVNGSCTNAWAWGNPITDNSTNCLYISNDGGTTHAYDFGARSMVYAYKTLDLEAGVYHVSYDWLASGEGSADYLRVALVPASVTLEAGEWGPTGFGYSILPDGWIALDGGWSLLSAIEWQTASTEAVVYDAGSYNMVFAWCNNHIWGANPPAAIDNVGIALVTCATPFNFTADTVTDTTAELSWNGFVDMDSYTVRYRPDTQSQPVMEDGFENGHDDWTLVNEYSNNWTQYASHSGQWSFAFRFGENPSTQYLISPELSGVTDGMKLEFYVVCYSLQFPGDFYVGFSSTDNAIESFTFGGRMTPSGTDWQLFSLDIPAGTKYVCFKNDPSSGVIDLTQFYIDDIYVGVVSPESPWQTVTVEGNATDIGVTLTGLTPGTRYKAQVKNGCEAGAWSHPIIFATEAAAVTQTIALQAGWNWVSFNVETTLNDLKAALVNALPGSSSITIKSKNTYSTYNGRVWRGTLNSLDVAQMYMVKVPADCEITQAGIRVNPTEHPVTLNFGANWIGFPLVQSMTLTNAFAGFAVTGDMVKSKNQYSSYNGSKWRGTLNTLVPGVGYMYKSTVSGNRVFTW